MVNVDSMRRGQIGQVELSPRIQALLDAGYLRLRGHVDAPIIKAPPAVLEQAETAAPTEPPKKRVRPSRAKRDALTTPPEDAPTVTETDNGDSAGDTHLE